jgi:hypothetical protein
LITATWVIQSGDGFTMSSSPLALGSPRFAWNLSGRTTVCFAIVIACELIHRRSEGLGWVGKARKSKGFATPTTQSILGRS